MSTTVQLQQIGDELHRERGERNAAAVWFFLGLVFAPVGIGLIIMPWGLINYFNHKGQIARLEDERLVLLQSTPSMRYYYGPSHMPDESA